MNGRWASVLAGVLILAAGCEREAPPGPATSTSEPPSRDIVAVTPIPMQEGMSRKPAFEWKLPKRLAQATLVSFLLAEAGTGEEPVTDESKQRRIATVTGLDASSPEAFNPWDPPGGCVVTGEIVRMSQLPPRTWYRWRVRAVSAGTGDHKDFYFRTGEISVVPGE